MTPTSGSTVALRPGLATAWALGFFVLLCLIGCAGDEDGSATVEVPCSIAIDEVDDIGPSYFAHGSDGGFIALPSEGWLPSRALQLGRMGAAGSEFEGFRFAKFGLVVRRDRVVSLEVVNPPGGAVLEFVHPDTPARVVRVGPCRAEQGEWVAFAGGVWVTEPACIELLAASGDERLRVRLAVASACGTGP